MSNSEGIQLLRRTREPSGGLAFSALLFCGIPLVFCVFPLLLFAIAIARIAIGALYLDDCPLQPYIPIYLIVGGAFALMPSLLSCLPCAKKPEDGSTNPLYSVCSKWNSLVSLFLSCWFITGNVWIFSIYPPNYSKNTTNVDPYCDKTLYLFAFWVTIVDYILLGSFLLLCCFFFWFTCCNADRLTEDV